MSLTLVFHETEFLLILVKFTNGEFLISNGYFSILKLVFHEIEFLLVLVDL